MTNVGALTVLAESDLTRVVHYQGDSPFLLMTFSSMRPLARRSDFWGDAYAKKNRVTTISFVAKSVHWYPSADTRDLISRVLPIIRHKGPRICYGFSMGAYASLKYARALRADVALAFSPQFSIDPDEISDPRFLENFRPHNAGMGLRRADFCKKNIIVYDHDFRPDRSNVRLIRRAGGRGIQLVNAPFTGHGTIELTTSSVVMTAVLEACLDKRERAAARIGALLRPRRRLLPAYYERLSKRARRSGRELLADRILEIGRERTSDSTASTIAAATALGAKDPRAAVAFLEDALKVRDHARLRSHLARHLFAAGEIERAEEIKRAFERRTNKVFALGKRS